MLLAVVVLLASSVYYYVEAVKNGLRAKRWAAAGAVFGPMLLPMFTMQRHVALRKVQGYHSAFWRP
ncbi:hypothetical protein HMF8227_01902 [Saliniradius amylolyticus]|uniref:Uncharacterized protein n=2 Tax=Saliniradius amylolyticus TaxID=2183582 RepID=A0A2S2E4D7_9ALTE|nr:hypothetical protein HMF8227_01902 [Saliniradius amylolyticus]